MPVIHYQHCPVCLGKSVFPVLEAVDYTVSNEKFSIWECQGCHLRFTQDVPDAASIGPYYQSEKYISHTDTRKGMINNLYHLVRQFTLKQKRKLLVVSTGKQNGTVLDIGAGTGAFLAEMKNSGWSVRGLEPDPGARKVAHDRYQLLFEDPSRLFDLAEGSFDVITMWHVLEHVHQLHEYIAHIKKILAPGGLLVLALPNYTSADAVYYGASWAAYDVPRHLYHFSPESVRKLLGAHGLSIKSMKPMWFDPFYISMLSEGYKNGRPNHLGAILRGLQSNIKARSTAESASSIIYIAGA
ncbi:class I SAM-dependent methyltransferase [Flavihumibacter profundi]|uniref:class I SAM-dependent methyltransferase n=1 Tax=Flavihumibacter profundi TaxID=2716883 RepID=UPI001CC59D1E|nr:class I SAM-dependent methyltransferase [Flavihumibacter profundi]MBZ5855729.1 class I SAM-dependent methyltransferase [Flavihumibacter profundi]